MRVVRYGVGPMENNTYVLVDEASGDAAVVDPSFGSQRAADEIDARGWRPVLLLNTHGHIDHTVENALFAERYSIPLALHADDVPLLEATAEQAEWFGIPEPRRISPTRLLKDGDVVAIGSGSVRVLHTPGHSPGGICLLGDGWVIVGDVLFQSSIGRADLPGGDMSVLLESIRSRLLSLPPATIVYPGHGPETTVGREAKMNPFLR
jgi:glyoxylase-like metal-dependent hydrolase (beta-lactamase superfamily II)